MAGDPLISIYAMKLQGMREQRRVEEERSIREKEAERVTINDAFDRTIKGYQANLQAESALDQMQFGVQKQMVDQRLAEMETLRKERELKLKEYEAAERRRTEIAEGRTFQTGERKAGQAASVEEQKRRERYQTSDKYVAAQVEIQKARALALQPIKTKKEEDKKKAQTLDNAYKDATKKKASQLSQMNKEINELNRKIAKGTGKMDVPYTSELAGWEQERSILMQQRKALKGINIIRNIENISQSEAEMVIIQGRKREEQGRVWNEYGTEGASTPIQSEDLSEEEAEWNEFLRQQDEPTQGSPN